MAYTFDKGNNRKVGPLQLTEEMKRHLWQLPRTDRGNLIYRIRSDYSFELRIKGTRTMITFNKDIDALVFKIKFKL